VDNQKTSSAYLKNSVLQPTFVFVDDDHIALKLRQCDSLGEFKRCWRHTCWETTALCTI